MHKLKNFLLLGVRSRLKKIDQLPHSQWMKFETIEGKVLEEALNRKISEDEASHSIEYTSQLQGWKRSPIFTKSISWNPHYLNWKETSVCTSNFVLPNTSLITRFLMNTYLHFISIFYIYLPKQIRNSHEEFDMDFASKRNDELYWF